MVRAFIMVKTTPGESTALLDSIREREGVREAHIVAGDVDLIAEVEDEEVYDVIHGVATAIRDVEGVVDTRTYISLA
jgi:DNA-binding Lrp family transcriptional regulator